MHNIKEIRNNINFFKNSLKKRFLVIDVDNILNLDEKNIELIQKKESLESEKKIISKNLLERYEIKSKLISNEIDTLNKDQLSIKDKLDSKDLERLTRNPLRVFLKVKTKVQILKYLNQELFQNLILRLKLIMS